MSNSSDAVLAALDKRVQHNFIELRRDLNGEVERFCTLKLNEVTEQFQNRSYGTIKDLVNEGVGALVKHVQTLENRCSELEKHIQALPTSTGTSRAMPTSSTGAATGTQACDNANLSLLCEELCARSWDTYYQEDMAARGSHYSVRQLCSKSTAPLPCAPTPAEVEQFLQCGEGRVEFVQQLRANGLGKPRMMLYFRSSEDAAAAYTAFRGSPNGSQAVLDYKRTHLQNMLVSLAIHLEKAAKESGFTEATFQSRGKFMLVKEGSGEAVHYPYLRHLWAGHPPGQGQPFNNVNAASVGEQLSRLLCKVPNPTSAPRASVPHTNSQQQRQQAPTSTTYTKATTQHQQRRPPTSVAATVSRTHPAPAATTSRTHPAPAAATPIHPQQQQPTAPATQRPAPRTFATPKAVRSKTPNKRIAVSPGTAASPTQSQRPPPASTAANNHHLPPPPPLTTMHPHPTISHASPQLQQAIASAPAKAASDLAARLATAEAEIHRLTALAAQPTNK